MILIEYNFCTGFSKWSTKTATRSTTCQSSWNLILTSWIFKLPQIFLLIVFNRDHHFFFIAIVVDLKLKFSFRCLEREYLPTKFKGVVTKYPFKDHNPPPLKMMMDFCRDVRDWLLEDKENVAVIHCKAGKVSRRVGIVRGTNVDGVGSLKTEGGRRLIGTGQLELACLWCPVYDVVGWMFVINTSICWCSFFYIPQYSLSIPTITLFTFLQIFLFQLATNFIISLNDCTRFSFYLLTDSFALGRVEQVWWSVPTWSIPNTWLQNRHSAFMGNRGPKTQK